MTGGTMTTPQSLRLSRWQRTRQGLWAGIAVAVVVLLLWASHLFAQVALRLSNLYFVPAAVSDHIVIVAVDDASLATYGRSLTEWSRSLYADLMDRLSAGEARVVAFDLIFDLPADGDTELAEAIQKARQSEARTRTVMPLVGVQRSTGLMSNAAQSIYFDNTLGPNRVIFDAVDSFGYVNVFPDVDGTIRRYPSLVQREEGMGMSFSLATYLSYLRIPAAAWPQVVKAGDESLQVTPERTVPIDERGFWVPNFFGPPFDTQQSTFTVVSLQDVLSGRVASSTFNDKIVLVGLMNISAFIDQYPTPSSMSGRLMAGVEIHANAIETLLQNQFVHEQKPVSQILTIIVLSLLASAVYTHLRWYWMLAAGAVLLIGWITLCFVIFSFQREMINLFHSSLALTLSVIANLGANFNAEVVRRKKTEFLLESVVQVSSQRLAMDKVLASIAEDVQRLVKSPTGGIWLWNEEHQALDAARQWSATPQETALLAATSKKVQEKQTTVIEQNRIAVPVIWQRRLVGVIAAQFGSQRAASSRAGLLQDFAQQVAPGLENAMLYTEIERQNALVEAILAGSPTGILVLTSELRLLRSNGALNKKLDLIPAQTNGKGLIDLLKTAGLPDDAQKGLEQNFYEGRAFAQEVPLGTKTFQLEAALLKESKQWVVVLNDVTALAELSKLKTHMIRMASHDLKNPIGVVLGYSSLILDRRNTPLPDQYRGFIEHILKAAEDMKRMVNDILNLEQLRSQTRTYSAVDMRAVADEVIRHHHLTIANKRQIFTTEIADGLPQVFGNYRHLIQAITNLLGNALKYTPDEGRITLRMFKSDDQMLRVEIEDSGYGMSAEAQKKLFTEFYRIRTEATADITGTGLGLSLVKTVIDAHGGRIWVKA